MDLHKLEGVVPFVGDGLCPRLGTPKLRAMLVLLLISPSDGLCVQGRPPTWLGKSRFAGRSSAIVAKPMPKHFPYGSSSFEKIRRSGQYFRDNTRFITELENNQNAGVLLTRPTRFGKTLLQGTLMVYYDEDTTRETYEELFRGLHIYNHTTEGRGKYQVLSLNFANAVGGTPGEREKKLWRHINNQCATFAKKYRYEKELDISEDAMITLENLGSAVKARRDSWGWRQGWRRKRPCRTRAPELYIFIDEYDSYIYSLLTRLPALLQEPTDKAREDLDSGVPVVTALNQLKSLEAADLVSRFMIIGLARVKWADASKANNIKLLSAKTAFGDACGLGLDDIKVGLDYLNLTEAQTLEALKLMKYCFNGYRFPGVGIGADDGLYNAQLCNGFLEALCVEENLRWLDPSDDEHWAKLTDSALVARMNDDQSDPPWAMVQLLARSGKAAADLLVLANGGSLEHSEDLLQQRYSIKALLDNSQLLERDDAVAATRNFMYDMGLATLDATGTKIEAPNAVVRELLRRKAVPAAMSEQKKRRDEGTEKLKNDLKGFGGSLGGLGGLLGGG